MVELVVPDAARHAEWLEMAAEFAPETHIDGSAIGSSIGMASLEQLRDPAVFADWVAFLLDNERGERLPCSRSADTSGMRSGPPRASGGTRRRPVRWPWTSAVGSASTGR